MLSQKYRQALDFAASLHHGHMRKGSEIDYLSHLLSVSALVMEHGGSEDEAIAGLLHDALEDQSDGYQSRFHGDPTKGREALKGDLDLLFGERVRDIVIACTDDEDYAPGHKSKASRSRPGASARSAISPSCARPATPASCGSRAPISCTTRARSSATTWPSARTSGCDSSRR